jgi:hypothetical protein
MLIAGLFLPITTAVWGGVYILARFGYMCAYLQAPKKRSMFVPIIIGSQMMMPLYAAVCCIVFYFYTPMVKSGNEDLDKTYDRIKSGVHTGFWGDTLRL